MTQPMRLQASNAVLRGAKGEVEPLPERLHDAQRADVVDPRLHHGGAPVAVCSPVFRRSDLVACWEDGAPAAAMPNTMTMFDLRVLVVRMLSQKADWRSLTFVGAEGSIAAAEEENQDLRPGRRGRRRRRPEEARHRRRRRAAAARGRPGGVSYGGEVLSEGLCLKWCCLLIRTKPASRRAALTSPSRPRGLGVGGALARRVVAPLVLRRKRGSTRSGRRRRRGARVGRVLGRGGVGGGGGGSGVAPRARRSGAAKWWQSPRRRCGPR